MAKATKESKAASDSTSTKSAKTTKAAKTASDSTSTKPAKTTKAAKTATTAKTANDPIVTSAAQTATQRLRARLDDGSGNAYADAQLLDLVDFWTQFRSAIAVNDASFGLEALDELAAAVLLQDDSPPAELTKTVLLLASPTTMAVAQASDHAVFTPPTAPTAPAAPARTKRTSRQVPLTPAKQPPAKKQKKKAPLPFDVPEDTPAEIIADLRLLEKRAAAKKKTPVQLAYPWHGQRAWYDHEDLHLAHWRFVMRYRKTFFLLALYAPTANSQYRRSLKAKALQARLTFLSANIEEFGWFGFMDRFENSTHDSLLWLGGKPAKHSTGAKDKPTDGDLVSLFRGDPKRYRAKLKRMLDPRRVDSDGYTSVPQLLEETGALDPTLKPHKRLSDRALARIVEDIAKNRDYRGEWVGNKTAGPWKELISYEPLRKEQQEVTALIETNQRVATFSCKPFKEEEQAAQDSDFKARGLYTVLGPDDWDTAGGSHSASSKKRKVSATVPGLESSDESDEEEDPPQDEEVDDTSATK